MILIKLYFFFTNALYSTQLVKFGVPELKIFSFTKKYPIFQQLHAGLTFTILDARKSHIGTFI
jgi:uncharacterized FAD-dependent dehydrogenase